MGELKPCKRDHPLSAWTLRSDGRMYCAQCKRDREQSGKTGCRNGHPFAEHGGVDRTGRRYCRKCNTENAALARKTRKPQQKKPVEKLAKSTRVKSRRTMPLCSATQRAEIDLECGHTVYYNQPSLFGEDLYCPRDQAWHPVKETRIVQREVKPPADRLGVMPSGSIGGREYRLSDFYHYHL